MCACSVAQLCPTLSYPVDCSPSGSSIEFSRQEYWSELPFPSPGDPPNPEIEPMSLALAGRFLNTASSGKPQSCVYVLP